MPDSKLPTFEEVANDALALDAARLHPDTIRDRRRVLEQYAFPYIGTVPLSELTCMPVVDVLLPIWREKPAQARKVKTLICRVVNPAIVSGCRNDHFNFDAVALALGAQPRPMPRSRLPFSEVPSVLTEVRESDASPASRLGLEFLVLTAARSVEVRGAKWVEMDLDAAVWTVPAERMKSSREHRVPLSRGVLAVLDKARAVGPGAGFIFSNARGRTLSASALSSLLRKLEIGTTPHSFRASFRDWCVETGVLQDDAELCLGHSKRGMGNVFCPSDRLVPRRKVMEDWAAYVLPDVSPQLLALLAENRQHGDGPASPSCK